MGAPQVENTAARQRALNRLAGEGLIASGPLACLHDPRNVSLEVAGVSEKTLPEAVGALADAGMVPYQREESSGHVKIVIDFSDFSWIRLLSAAEVARIFGVGKTSVYGFLRTGELTGVKLGGKWRISAQAVHDFLKAEGLLHSDDPDFDRKAR